MLPLIAFPAYSVYHLSFQHPKRQVSVGALNDVKPDLEGLGQLHQVWILSHHGEVGRNFDGGVLIVMHCRSHMTKTLASPRVPDGARRVFTVSGGPPFLLA